MNRFSHTRLSLSIALCCFGLLAGIAAAQDTISAAPPADHYLIAAREELLWLGFVETRESLLFRRAPAADFDLGRPVNGRVSMILAQPRDVLTVFDNGAIYAFNPDSPTASSLPSLPGNALPIDLLADGDGVFAIIEGASARALSRPAASAPADGASAELQRSAVSLAALRGDAWEPLVACEPVVNSEISGPLRPRLGIVGDHFVVAWKPAPNRLSLIHRPRRDLVSSWTAGRTFDVPRARAFWLANVGGNPTLLVAIAAADSESKHELTAFQLSGNPRDPAGEWVSVAPELSRLDTANQSVTYAHAAAFNQQIALVALADGGAAYLQFGRFGSSPTEPTITLKTVVSAPATAARNYNLFHLVSFVALAAVFAGLLLFRRDSMVKSAVPPPGMALAPAYTRLLAFLIDFTPFSVAASISTGAGWIEGFGELANWSLWPGATDFPESKLLLWWGLSAIGYVLYATTMELITGRTVGKVLLGLSLMRETGTKATWQQVLGRNAMRLIELLPQFWACGFLVVLSRNRQRLGDIFARTIVVRRAADTGRRSGEAQDANDAEQ